MLTLNQVHQGHCLDLFGQLPDNCIHSIITSPPYWGLRDYGILPVCWPSVSFVPVADLPPVIVPEQTCCLGLEPDIWVYVAHMVLIFREARRVLRDDGVLWLNLGDSYASSGKADRVSEKSGLNHGNGAKDGQKSAHAFGRAPAGDLPPKNLLGIPWRVALALQADGWYLRSDIIWAKPNPMPESVTDRPTKAHEYVFLLAKSERYYYDQEAIREDGKEHIGQAGTFARKNGKMNDLDIPNQLKVSHREDRDDRVPTGRNRRTVWTVFQDAYDTFKEWLTYQPESVQYSQLVEMLVNRFNEERKNKIDVFKVATQSYSAAHFATFPEKLIEPMVLAGPGEVCGNCGKPWGRVVEKVGEIKRRWSANDRPTENDNWRKDNGRDTQNVMTTTGWQPSCTCNAPTVPAVILDPFMGSGTTGKVAIANRRNFIGFEMNPTYAGELATDRIDGTQIKF